MGTDSTKQKIFINSSVFGTRVIFFSSLMKSQFTCHNYVFLGLIPVKITFLRFHHLKE